MAKTIQQEFKITEKEKELIIQHYVKQFCKYANEIDTDVELALNELWERGPHDDVDAEVVVSVTINPSHILNVLETLR